MTIDIGSFSVCNPWIAHQAMLADSDVGLLLPCNVVIREDKDHFVIVSFTAPEILLGLTYRTDLLKLGVEVREAVLADTKMAGKV